MFGPSTYFACIFSQLKSNKTNTTTKHSPNKEPTTQQVSSSNKIISAHNLKKTNKKNKIARTHHTFSSHHLQLLKALLYSTFDD
jgi:hypothetical protein